jgi:uncharacterized Zn-finger protein
VISFMNPTKPAATLYSCRHHLHCFDPMAERSSHHYSSSSSSSYHWNNGQQYPSTSGGYPTMYQHSQNTGDLSHHSLHHGYPSEHPEDVGYQRDYYPSATSQSPSAGYQYPSSHEMSYAPQRPSHSHSHSQSHVHVPSSYRHGHSPSQSQSQQYPSQGRPRSHSQVSPYPRSSPIMVPQQTPAHYQTIPQAISISPQYPASPQRPFPCDLCTLSFNRQHDLKRHRETHSGEKPYLCNGGCGKTFTRKDALKRHQVGFY